jgi:restriction system protein
MAKPPHRKSRRRNNRPFLEKGLTALVVGAGLFLTFLILSKHPVFGALGVALLTPAWLATGIGVLLLGIHYVLQDKARDSSSPPLPKIEPPPQRASTTTMTPVRQEQRTRSTASAATEFRATDPAHTAWNSAVFKAIEWRRFEAVCETLFTQGGFEPRSQSHGPDGGVDLWLYSKHAQGPALVVQCKHWQSKPVGVKEVREFFGVMASHQLKRGTYATTSKFTPDALAFAKSNGIHLLDGAGLLKLIATRTPEQQQALLAVAFEGDYARPTCASCGAKMVERKSSKDGSAFWGCANHPRCWKTMTMARQAT